MENKFDINVLLAEVDVIITDYSSVIFDSIYRNKSLLFYVPDLVQYKKEDRGFAIRPEEFMVGLRADNVSELIDNLSLAYQNPENVKTSEYEHIKRRVWGMEKNMDEIWNDICGAIGI